MVASIARPIPLSRSASTPHDADASLGTHPAIVEGEPAGIRHVRVFVSSPGDTGHERGRVKRVVERLNLSFAGTARLETILWETEFYPAHDTFQAVIEARTPPTECDIVIAVFRHRIGTELPPTFARQPDGSPYPSGTAYEVLSALEHYRRFSRPDVFVFRHPNPPMVQLDDPKAEETQEQWERLKAFWETSFVDDGGHFLRGHQTYTSLDDFEAQLAPCLRGWLEKKIRDTRPAVSWPIEVMGSPFRGLAAFGAKHKDVFFGRSGDIARQVDKWKDAAERGTPFLLLIGPSGAGKSSLARAGLVPAITTPGVVPTVELWRVAVMHPSEAADGPIMSLATRLFDGEHDLPEDERGRPPALPEIAEGDYRTPAELARPFVEAGPAAGAPVIRALERTAEAERARRGSAVELDARLLIVVDQLDELFAPDVAPEQRAIFVRLLAGLAETGRVWLLATLRADLYERFQAEPALLALKTSGAEDDVMPPEPAELAEIVRKPAEAAGLVFETDPASRERLRLDELLLRDAEQRPDMLPLLQLALDRLFESRVAKAEKTVLTVAAYESLGGLAGIIDREAERALIGLDETEIARLPRLLRQLAAIGELDGGEASATSDNLTIRTAPLAKAAPDEDAASRHLVNALVAARILLTSGKGVGAGIRLAHQRVLTDWARARRHVDDSKEFFSIRKDVEDRRREWNEAGRSRDQLLQPGRSLNRAERIVQNFGEELSPETLEFVRASGRRARMRHRLTFAAAVVFAVLAVIAGGAWIFAKNEEQRAEASLDKAKDALKVIDVDIAQGLRYVEGVPTATIQTILERIQDTVEGLTRFAPDNVALSRVYLESLLEFATTYQMAGDMQRARNSAMTALARSRELALRYPDDPEWQWKLTVTLNRLGFIERSGGEETEALKAYKEAAGIMRPIADRDPNNVTWQRELALSLEGIGDVKSETGDARSALAAYDEGLAIIRRLARDHPDDAELQRQIDIDVRLDKTGDMKLATGDTTGAEADYQEGLTIARGLVERNPGNTQWQRDVFFSLIKIGDLKVQVGDPTAAIAPYGEAVAIVRHLAELDPANPLRLLDVGQGLCKMGDVDLKERDRDYEEGLTIMRRLVQRYPDKSRYQRELSVSLNKVGDVKLQGDDTDGAITAYSEALTIVGHLAERDPENLVWLRDVALSLREIADVKLRTGDANSAIANYEQAAGKLRPLSEHDPNNALWLGDLTATLNKLGDAELRTGDTSAAATSYEESLATARHLAGLDPGNAQWQWALRNALNNVAGVKLRTGNANGAVANYEEAVATVRRLLDRDPNNALRLRDLTVTLNRVGDIKSTAGDAAAAAASYDESLATARHLVELDPGNAQGQSDLWYALYGLANAKLKLGDRAGARSLYAEGLTIIRALAKDPGNVDGRMNLVVNLCRIAGVEDGPEREHALKEALAILEQTQAANQLPPDKIAWLDQVRKMLAN